MQGASAAAGALAAAPARSQDAASRSRVIGANDRINVGQIGVGGRGGSLQRLMLQMIEGGQNFKITAVCDVYEKSVAGSPRRTARQNSRRSTTGRSLLAQTSMQW